MGPRYGQLVVGPPGSGKTTYCRAAAQFYNAIGRKCVIVNLDPANSSYMDENDDEDGEESGQGSTKETKKEKAKEEEEAAADAEHCAIDINNLIALEEAMDAFGLGPNGGLIYCMEYLESNMDWLEERLNALDEETYVLFDIPGQVEITTHHHSLPAILARLTSKELNWRLCCVHLVDAHHCVDPGRYISALIVSLKAMIQLELPHVNVLSKVDLVQGYGRLQFSLDYYARASDLSYIHELLDEDPRTKKYAGLNKALCNIIEEFGLVGFKTLCVEDKRSLVALAHEVDNAIGYVAPKAGTGSTAGSAAQAFQDAVSTWMDGQDELRRIEELYLSEDVVEHHD